MKKVCVLIILIASLASCRSTKKIATAIAKKDTIQSVNPSIASADSAIFINNLLGLVAANRINFNSFSGKVNIDYRGGDGKNYDVNATLRMYKDSAIWLSANAVLGIEAIRVLITKDSVKLLNKLEKTYTARSIGYLQEITALPLDLKTLQDLLIGNPVYLDSNIVSYSQYDNAISIISIGEWFKNLLTINGSDKTIQRSKLDDVNITRNRTADLTYENYENKKGPLFSTERRINIAEKKKLEIKLEFKNYDFNNEVSFPFSIPRNYTSD